MTQQRFDDVSFDVGPFLFSQANCWFWTVLSVECLLLCAVAPFLCNSKIVLLRLLCSTLSSLLGIGGTIGHEAGQQVIQLQGSLV